MPRAKLLGIRRREVERPKAEPRVASRIESSLLRGVADRCEREVWDWLTLQTWATPWYSSCYGGYCDCIMSLASCSVNLPLSLLEHLNT